jgi:pimeloyl-ACP methyl ester carboxylesterase
MEPTPWGNSIMPEAADKAAEQLNIDEQYKFLKMGDLQIAYRELGEGNPVLLVHGFGASSYTWEYAVQRLPSNYRYILLDLKGFGKSDKPIDDAYRLVDQAAILEHVIGTLDLSQVTLIGHSYGGAVVLTYLLGRGGKNAGRVRGLVLIGTLGYDQFLPPLIARLNVPIVSGLGLRTLPAKHLVRMSLEDVFFDDAKIQDDLVQEYARALRSHGGRKALLATARYLSKKDGLGLSAQISTLQFPSLIIWGQHDEIVPLRNAARFNADIVGSEVKIIPNCGHAPQEECPSETANVIGNFLHQLNR